MTPFSRSVPKAASSVRSVSSRTSEVSAGRPVSSTTRNAYSSASSSHRATSSEVARKGSDNNAGRQLSSQRDPTMAPEPSTRRLVFGSRLQSKRSEPAEWSFTSTSSAAVGTGGSIRTAGRQITGNNGNGGGAGRASTSGRNSFPSPHPTIKGNP